MLDYSKIFNPNKSTFLFADSARGKYLNEIPEADQKKVVTARLSGFKAKNLSSLTGFMPGLKELAIEKNTKLLTLEGIQQWNLEKLSLEGCSAILDYKPIATLKSLKEFKSTSVPTGTEVLKYMGSKVKDLGIDPNAADIELLSEMSGLQHLSLVCERCNHKTLPVLPKGLKSLLISGDFENLNDASFLANLNCKINLTIWIDTKSMKNIPAAFKNHDQFT